MQELHARLASHLTQNQIVAGIILLIFLLILYHYFVDDCFEVESSFRHPRYLLLNIISFLLTCIIMY